MRHAIPLAVLIACFVLPSFAQGGKCTEEFIKAQAQSRTKPTTDDTYFFGAAYDEPIVGKEALEKAGATVAAKRKNAHNEDDKPERIVLAASGDMAYEYGTRRLSFDEVDTGKHNDLTTAYLRVWKTENGSCKIAAAVYEREHHQ